MDVAMDRERDGTPEPAEPRSPSSSTVISPAEVKRAVNTLRRWRLGRRRRSMVPPDPVNEAQALLRQHVLRDPAAVHARVALLDHERFLSRDAAVSWPASPALRGHLSHLALHEHQRWWRQRKK